MFMFAFFAVPPPKLLTRNCLNGPKTNVEKALVLSSCGLHRSVCRSCAHTAQCAMHVLMRMAARIMQNTCMGKMANRCEELEAPWKRAASWQRSIG